MSPSADQEHDDELDKELVARILKGDKEALNTLVDRHQPYIYNLAWKMAGNPSDAADLSQEVLLKIISKLAGFKFQSKLKTWMYRIVINHFIDQRKKQKGSLAVNYDDLGNGLNVVQNVDLNIEEQIIHKEEIREIRLKWLSGMLLCLSKEQRVVYLLGDVLGAGHALGAEIMNISKSNFRTKLSRARRDLGNFMQNKCGLINKNNPCRCRKRVTTVLQNEIVEAKELLPNQLEYAAFLTSLEHSINSISDDSEMKMAELHRFNSCETSMDKKTFLIDILEDRNWQKILNLN